jgi:hypothetical protein
MILGKNTRYVNKYAKKFVQINTRLKQRRPQQRYGAALKKCHTTAARVWRIFTPYLRSAGVKSIDSKG